MASNCTIEDYLEDALERARDKKEYYATALFSNLAILRPDLLKKVNIRPDELYTYNPKKWNEFLSFLGNNWYG